jgi:uncharacterized membrane protein
MSYVLSFIYIGIYWNKLQYANYPSTRNSAVALSQCIVDAQITRVLSS